MTVDRNPWDNASFYISIILIIFGLVAIISGTFSYEWLFLMGYRSSGSLIGLGLVIAIIFWAAAYAVYVISNWQKWKTEGRENK
ncbi:MAG: hypothetical protein ACYCT2_00935 [Thermoplasmataceae archaeon]